MIVIFSVCIYILIWWITSLKYQKNYYPSSLYAIGIVIMVVFVILFFGVIVASLINSHGTMFWGLLGWILLLTEQFISNVKDFINSKREERLFISTVSHIINTQGVEHFTVDELVEATKIPYQGEIARLFDLTQKNGHIPNTIVLSGRY